MHVSNQISSAYAFVAYTLIYRAQNHEIHITSKTCFYFTRSKIKTKVVISISGMEISIPIPTLQFKLAVSQNGKYVLPRNLRKF